MHIIIPDIFIVMVLVCQVYQSVSICWPCVKANYAFSSFDMISPYILRGNYRH